MRIPSIKLKSIDGKFKKPCRKLKILSVKLKKIDGKIKKLYGKFNFLCRKLEKLDSKLWIPSIKLKSVDEIFNFLDVLLNIL